MNPDDDFQFAAEMLAIPTQSLQQRYVCHWIAFTSLYEMLTHRAGLRPHFGLRQNGTLRTRRIGDIKMAEVYAPLEATQLDKVLHCFNEDLKHQLVIHENTLFFVQRTPVYEKAPLHHDAYKQRLNGVLDLALTLDPRYPAWAPIDTELHTQYRHNTHTGNMDSAVQNKLVRQILDVLRAVYHNVLYSASAEESRPRIVEKALPLLDMIVQSLLTAAN